MNNSRRYPEQTWPQYKTYSQPEMTWSLKQNNPINCRPVSKKKRCLLVLKFWSLFAMWHFCSHSWLIQWWNCNRCLKAAFAEKHGLLIWVLKVTKSRKKFNISIFILSLSLL
jgi:hypothetical protein